MNKKIISRILTLVVLAYLGYSTYSKNEKRKIIEHASSEFYAGNFDDCQRILINYTKTYPNQTNGWTFLGNVYIELYNDSLAEISYKKALSIDSDNSKALTGMGIVKRSQGKYDEAEQFYLKAIKSNPKNAKSYSSLLVIELKRKNYNKAVELGEKALVLLDSENGIKGNLMVAYHYAGLFEKRDKIMKELESSDYNDLIYLKMFIDGSISIDDI